MFYVLIFSILNGIYLLWQSFKNPEIVGWQKTAGIILGAAGFVWLAMLALKIVSSGTH